MHRSPGFNPPEKESTRTSTSVDRAAAGRRFKGEHRERENKNYEIYIYIHTYKCIYTPSPPPPSKFPPSFFFEESVHPMSTWLFGERFEWIKREGRGGGECVDG